MPPLLSMEPHQSYNSYLNVNVDLHDHPTDRERVPQWTQAETAELLALRAELDASFMVTKRNKPLWDAVSARMHQKGFPRTPDQCKSKWKNLLTRFKGSEAMAAESSRQFPFHDEMQRIFTDRMERLLTFDEGKGKGKGKGKGVPVHQIQEHSDKKEREESKKRKKKRLGSVESALMALTRWQMETEARRVKEWEAREDERRRGEEEWRAAAEAMTGERVAMEGRWRAREEERRAREEERAERWHSLFTAILTKLSDN